jgi:hypothetical protein
MATRPDDLLRSWQERIPRDGVPCADLVSVMRHLGMKVDERKSGHWTGSHGKLVGSTFFPQGVITVSCHAFGKQGNAHPNAIRDIIRATTIIREDLADE